VSKERSTLRGDKDQKIPKGAASVAPVANVADAACNTRPVERQLLREACHQDLETEESHLAQGGAGADLDVAGSLDAERSASSFRATRHVLGGSGGRTRLGRIQCVEDDRQSKADIGLADTGSI